MPDCSRVNREVTGMQYLVRMRVFLLCCLLMIVMNVLLIMGGLSAGGFAPGEAHSQNGCVTRSAS